MANFTLSTVQPDYEQINQQLTAYLTNKESWASAGNSKTGTLLIDAISAIGAYDQYSIWAAINETTLENAVLPESIYTNNIFLGNRLKRATPAKVSVSLQNTNFAVPYLEIPKFTQFTIEGEKFFNRDVIVFDGLNMQQTITLYEGQISSAQFTSSGSTYQKYNLTADSSFSISDEDILCYVGNDEFKRTTDAIFTQGSNAKIFYENSDQAGNVNCLFGDGIYGAIPSAGSSVVFKYAVTNGSSGNNTAVNQKVTANDYPDLIGETLTNPSGGDDAPSITFYQQLGSQSAAANGRAISRNDIRALVCKYPEIIDCRVYCQAEIAPLDKDWMNVIGLLLLTKPTFNEQSWKDLVTYLGNYGICGLQYKKYDAQPVPIDIKAILYLKPGATLTISQQKVEAAIRKYMTLQVGSLGRSFYKSDLEDIAFSILPNDIDYIERESPSVDYVLNQNQYLNLNSLEISCKYSERNSQYWVDPLTGKEG